MSEHEVLAHVDEYLQIGIEYDCSDIHLPTGYPPAWRRFGTLSPIWDTHAPLKAADTERLARSFGFTLFVFGDICRTCLPAS